MPVQKRFNKKSVFYVVVVILATVIIFGIGFYLGGIFNNNFFFSKTPQAKISIDELKTKNDRWEGYVLLDLRSPEEYKEEHLPHATSVPYSAFQKPNIIDRISPFLDKRDEIILYCRGTKCQTSEVAARQLIGLGFNNIKVLDGGVDDWKARGWSTEK